MKKKHFFSTLLPILLIPVAGLLALGICYGIYLLLYNFVEFQFFPTNPTAVPAGIIRRSYTVVLLVLYGFLFHSKAPDILKSSLLVGPLGIFFTTAILTFSENPIWAIPVIVALVALSIFLLYKWKKPWFYYYALAITVLVSIALAWP